MSSPARPGSRTPRRQEPAEEAPRTPRTPRTPRQQQNVEEEPRTPRTPRTPRQPARATPARAGPSTGTPRGTPGRFATPSKTPGKNVPGSGRPGSRSSRSDSSAFTPQRAQRQLNGGGMVIDASDSNPPSSSPAVRDRASSPLGYVGGMSEIDLSSPLNYGTPSSMGSIRTPRSGVRGTPIRLRPDIRTDKRMRQINIQPPGSGEPREASSQPSSEPDAAQEPGLVIWGTDVSVSRCKERFKLFVETFIEPNTDQDERLENMDDSQPLYIQKLEEVNFLEDPFLNLNCAHLESFDATLARQLICYPQEVIPILDMAINEMFFEKHPAAVLSHQIQIRPFNTHMTKNMRSLNPEDVDQLITLTGMVIRTSNTIPEMREAFFKCMACDFTTSVEIDRGRIAEPTLCTNCNTNHCFGLIHNRSQFTDKQMVKLQESPDDMPAGQTPHTIVLYAHNDLVDAVLPGDRVYVTGIYRAIPIKVNPRMSSVRAIYKTYIDVVHFRKIDNKRLYEQEGTSLRLTPERIELLKSLSEKADVYDRLSRAIAPSIFGNEDIKKGILLQLFGGTKKNFSSEGRGHFRAELNILLCGDPGTSKSQLLSYVYNLVPRSQYTSGKGSSAVGLTAYVTRDPESRQLVLQTGALVLADNGICCIDEFDKMDDSTRSVLHEVMEQQTLSIAKAGIICQLNARTSVLAAANPCESQWNTNKTIIENIQLPHTLLSRFDLIFLLLDPQSDVFDRKLARHLVSLYYRSQEEEEDEMLDRTILRDYLAYAKENIRPQLTEEASQSLVQTYVDMRAVGSGKGQVSAYPRQLESLIRLSEAHAKMRFSQKVEVEDVQEAYRLHREALKQSAVDPATGKIDIGIITTGYSMSARERRTETTQLLKKLLSGKPKSATLNSQKLFKELKDSASFRITPDMFEESLKDCQDDNLLVIVNKSTIRLS